MLNPVLRRIPVSHRLDINKYEGGSHVSIPQIIFHRAERLLRETSQAYVGR